MNRETIKQILHRNEKESTCGMYDFVHREDYEKVSEEIIATFPPEKSVRIDLKECLSCGVPAHSHGTCCGWNNASGFITNGRFDAETKKEDWTKFKATLEIIETKN